MCVQWFRERFSREETNRESFVRTREHRYISNPFLVVVDATESTRKYSRLHAIVVITGKNGGSAIERDALRLPTLFDSYLTRSRFFFCDIVEPPIKGYFSSTNC